MFVRALRPEHPLHSPQKPALVRVVSYPDPAISSALSGVVTPPVLRARCLAPISAADLFSRAPAGTRHPQAQSFRSSDRCWLSRVSNRVGARLSSRIHLLRRQKTIAGRLALGSQAVGAASASCYRITTLRAMNGVPSKRPCERCQPATTWVTRIADAPCRIPPACSASRAHQRVPEPASPRSTKSAVPQTRGAFHRQVPPSLSDSRRPATAWAATGTPGSSPGIQLPTCVHDPTLGTLDPPAYRLLTGADGPHASCQLLQRSIPRARHRTVRTSMKPWQATFPPNSDVPFEPPPTELPQVRGHLACSAASTPTTATARHGGFTPT